jgi:hypothetical protein
MIITYVYPSESDNWEGIEWRCHVPAKAINRTGVHKANVISDVDFAYHSNQCITHCIESDVIVIYNKIYGRIISAIHHWQARDKTIVVDFDEAYQLLDPTSEEYKFWFEGSQITSENNLKYISPAPMTQFKWGLKLVDGITVPSDRLANDWMSFNEIGVIPNYINMESYTAPKAKRVNGNFVIGWHGRNTRLMILKECGALEAVIAILNKNPEITFEIYLDDIYKSKMDELEHEQINVHERVGSAEWLEALPHIHIGLIPFIGLYDQRKSMRTALEYMVMKIPWVGSNKSILYEAENYGSIVENNVEDWMIKLEDILVHYDQYKDFALQEPFLYGIGKSIDENIGKSISVYKGFIAAKRY